MHLYPTYSESSVEAASAGSDIVRGILSNSVPGIPTLLAVPSFAQKRAIVVSLIRTVLRRTLIITPNIAAQSMWHDRYGRMSSPLPEAASLLPGGKIANAVSTLPLSCAPIVVMTLSSLSSPSDGAAETEEKIERLSRHFVRYRYGLVIFDGCEPIPDAWMRLVAILAGKTSATVVSIIPHLENPSDGEKCHGIPIPALIRDGALPVCRNLAYFVETPPMAVISQGSIGGIVDAGDGHPTLRSAALNDSHKDTHPGKFVGVRDILLAEQQHAQEQLRAMVLTDPLDREEATVDQTSPLPPSGENLLRTLADDAEIRSLHPILLTGSTLVCHDDLVIPLLSEMQRLINTERWDVRLRRITHAEISGIEGDGADWNSRTYVLFVQELLLRGITRCVIADRELVREGWEHTRINTMIDTSPSNQQLFLNQESSALSQRRDPSSLPLNFWTVLSCTDASELHRWHSRIDELFGPADDGLIEKGAGQFDPVFERLDVALSSDQCMATNIEALRRAGRRDELSTLWSPAMMSGHAPVQCADLLLPEQEPRVPDLSQRHRLESEISRYLERKQSQRMLYTLWGVLAVGIIMSGVLLLSLHSGPYIAAAAVLTYVSYVLIHSSRLRRMRPSRVTVPASSYLATLAVGLLQALKTAGDIPATTKETDIRISRRGNGRVRVALAGTDPDAALLFAESLLAMVTSDRSDAPSLLLTSIDVTGISLNDASRLSSFDGLRVPAGSVGIPPRFRDEPLRIKAFRDSIENVVGGTQAPVEAMAATNTSPALLAETEVLATLWV